jgi:hypothetical protein
MLSEFEPSSHAVITALADALTAMVTVAFPDDERPLAQQLLEAALMVSERS